MRRRGEPLYTLDQMTRCQFYEDWMDDYDGPYEAAEDWIADSGDGSNARLVRDIELLFATTTSTRQRLEMFEHGGAFRQDDDSFDTWLRAVQQRATEALAGIHHPLEDTWETLHHQAQRERLEDNLDGNG